MAGGIQPARVLLQHIRRRADQLRPVVRIEHLHPSPALPDRLQEHPPMRYVAPVINVPPNRKMPFEGTFRGRFELSGTDFVFHQAVPILRRASATRPDSDSTRRTTASICAADITDPRASIPPMS